MCVKVMIVDDHKMIREGLKQLIELEGDMKVIEEAENGLDCIEKLEVNKPEILLLDINMPKMNGIQTLEKIKEEKMDLKVLMLTVHSEVEYLLKAVDIGVDGYILKDADSTELRKAIFSIVEGNNYIQSSLIPLLNSKMIARDVDSEKIKLLTKRELEILMNAASGMSNKEIGDKLQISERTVKNHISSVFKKIEVSDRTQAAVFAIRNNLIRV
ncbi:MAG: response regulator transcription factor [Lachnospiraceae bacterium]|nr:response regulator transcription factor [Lachnospiraceae bacterium]